MSNEELTEEIANAKWCFEKAFWCNVLAEFVEAGEFYRVVSTGCTTIDNTFLLSAEITDGHVTERFSYSERPTLEHFRGKVQIIEKYLNNLQRRAASHIVEAVRKFDWNVAGE